MITAYKAQGSMIGKRIITADVLLFLRSWPLRSVLLLCMLTGTWTQTQSPHNQVKHAFHEQPQLTLLHTARLPPCQTLPFVQALSFGQQEQAATRLRAQIADHSDDPNLHLELATILHGLDQLHPNGGQRIPEAERAYR